MDQKSDNELRPGSVLLLLVFGIFLVASPFFQWWAIAERPWYLFYLVWLGIILLIYILQRR